LVKVVVNKSLRVNK